MQTSGAKPFDHPAHVLMLALCSIGLLAAFPGQAAAQAPVPAPAPAQMAVAAYRLAPPQRLGGATRWDYLAFDPASKLLYITHGDQVEVFDTVSRTVAGSIGGLHGTHGVALAPDLDRGYITNGGDGTVSVFALSTRQVLASVAAGKNPDAIAYDPASRRVFAANGGSADFTVIDGAGNRAIGSIPLGGKPEFIAVDGRGKLFVNIEDKNMIAVIDTASLKVTARFDLSASCDEPAGLAIDVQRNVLFAGCHNQKMVIVDAASGRILDALPIGRGSDATAFDPQLRRAFSSNGDGSLDVIEAGADGRYRARQSLPTSPGARTMALDAGSHALYLVTGELDHLDEPSAQNPRPRPVYKPGSFTLLTVLPTSVAAQPQTTAMQAQ